MSEWESGGPSEVSGLGRMARQEECKPDYEKAIKYIKDEKVLLVEMYDVLKKAIYSDFDLPMAKSKLKDLLGLTHVSILGCEHNIERLIVEQEKE